MISNSSVQPDLHCLDHAPERELWGTSSPFQRRDVLCGSCSQPRVRAGVLQSGGFVCSGGNQCRQGGCAWRLASGPICATDHRKASQHPHTVIPCLASRKDAALHALLGSRQKLVVCWVPISVSAPGITRSGNKTLPSLRCLSLMHLSTVHSPACRAVPLPAAPLWGWQTLL